MFDAPRLDADTRNPRRADIAAGRGTIVARNGTPLAITRNGKRVYPLGSITAHVIGYASPRYGTAGLEDAFDRVLTAQAASAGAWAELASLFTGTRNVPRGAEVVTTLDLDVQRALAAALGERARAAGIVMDPRTGAVMALAAMPVFDPNTLDHNWKSLVGDTASPLLDRSTSGLYPPGSTFKIVTAGDALDAGLVTPATTFVDTGGLTVGNFVVRNDQNEVTGTQNLTGAFALSSNVDFATIALKIGAERWFDYAARWGLGQAVNFDLPVAHDRLPRGMKSPRRCLPNWASGKHRSSSRRSGWRSSRQRSPMAVERPARISCAASPAPRRTSPPRRSNSPPRSARMRRTKSAI